MSAIRTFVVEFVRLALLIAAILAGRAIILLLPMVRELPRLPVIGASAEMLITALAFITILILLVAFAKKIEMIAAETSVGFPWASLVSYVLVLVGIVFAYRALTDFASTLLGRYYWFYPLTLLLFACIPIFQIGSVLYRELSERLERWEQ